MRVFDPGERSLPACSRYERRDQYRRKEKRVNELAILRAMNENKFQSLPIQREAVELGASD